MFVPFNVGALSIAYCNGFYSTQLERLLGYADSEYVVENITIPPSCLFGTNI